MIVINCHLISHKCVQTIEVQPKLKFTNAVYLVENTSWNRNLIGILQEFQYGYDIVGLWTENKAKGSSLERN